MGAGAVSIPFGLSQGGWAALGLLWLLGLCFCYTGHLVLQCCALVEQHRREKRQAAKQEARLADDDASQQPGTRPAAQQPGSALPGAAGAAAAAPHQPSAPEEEEGGGGGPVGYEALAGAAFGPWGRALVSAVMYAELLGICCVYVVLEAETLAALLGHTRLGAALLQAAGPGGWVLLASALIAPTVLLPGLDALAALGALGVAAATSVGLLLAGLLAGLPGPTLSGLLSSTSLVCPQTLPQVLGVLAFVYAGHSTFPVIQASMAAPQRGGAALTWGYALTAAICSLIGAAGYALFGPATREVVTANLPPGSALALLAAGLTLANPFSAFALTLEPVALALQRRAGALAAAAATKAAARRRRGGRQAGGGGASAGGPGLEHEAGGAGQATGAAPDAPGDDAAQPPPAPYALRASIRLGLALAVCSAAALLPYVADLMGLVGALLTMSVSLILPALMHVRLGALLGHALPWWLLGVDGCVLLLGVACAAIGATSAAANLQHKLAAAAATAAL